jgi:integrase
MKNKALTISDTSSVRQACEFYFRTPKFLTLTGNTQKDYEVVLIHTCNTPIQNGKLFGNVKLKEVRFKHITHLYDTWLNTRGVRRANYHATCLSILFNTAIRHEAMISNPVSLIQRTPNKPRKVKWTEEQVKLFLDTAYSDFRWRSIGLIAHMAYDWAQRMGDMRLLQWSNIDFDLQRLDLEQSKRRADVHIPIDDALIKMLIQQREDFGFQDYVAPRVTPRNGNYNPYSIQEVSILVNEVKEEAGLPNELWGMDLRRTGITEMVEAGVDITGIMQVSGHNSPQSVMPYLVNTFSGASTALNKRKANKK